MPTWKAAPRRESPRYQLISKYVLDKVKILPWMLVLDALVVVVDAFRPPPAAVSRAMVVGMAMALEGAPSRDWAVADSRKGDKGLSETSDAAHKNTEDPVGIVSVTLTFTPLHTGSADTLKFVGNMFIWGRPPPRQTGAN